MVRYLFASFLTLGLICSLSFGFIVLILLMSGELNLWIAIFITIGINLLILLISPWFTDLINRWFYHLTFLTPEEVKAKHPEVAELIKKICDQYKFKFPKVGIIADKNPTAFTYGSGRYNARLVLTEGIFHFLNTEEQKAVVAHEMGHIVNRDFIVMMIASTAVQILYQIYAVLIRAKGKKAGNAKLVALAAYVAYVICVYLLLYLSRTREYLADRFSTNWTEPRHLAEALIKIAYGIVSAPDEGRSKDLLRSTRHLGIVDVKNAKHIGVVSYITHENPDRISDVMVFDRVNPWATIIELNSTHPLTGNRLDHLSDISREKKQTFPYDIDKAVERMKPDYGRLYGRFFTDLFVYLVPFLLAGISLLFLPPYFAIAAFGLGLFAKIFYKYPSGTPKESTVLDEMCDPYLSPVRGKAVSLKGKVIGQGVPGYVFSEDMMYQDKSGMSFLDYNSAWGFIGNLFFALTKVKAYFGLESEAKGWFFRGMGSRIMMDSLHTKNGVLESYPRLWSFIFAILVTGAGLVLGMNPGLI